MSIGLVDMAIFAEKEIQAIIFNVVATYRLGYIISFTLLQGGLDDINIKLITNLGSFVIRIFSNNKSQEFIESYVNIINRLYENNAAVPKILSYEGKYIFKTETPSLIKIIVTKFFYGEDFNKITPYPDDFTTISKYLAKIHLTPLIPHSNYDSWGTANLKQEFNYKKGFLAYEEKLIIESVIEESSNIDLRQLPYSLIHGDLRREHVLKNNFSEYLIIDFGCMDYQPSVIDISIFLALFVINQSLSIAENKHNVGIALRGYISLRSINLYEMRFLPNFIRATWASYLLNSRYNLAIGNNLDIFGKWIENSSNLIKITEKENNWFPYVK